MKKKITFILVDEQQAFSPVGGLSESPRHNLPQASRQQVCNMLFGGGWDPPFEPICISHGSFWFEMEPPLPEPAMSDVQFWRDEAGNPPPPYTVVTAQDVREGKYKPAKTTLTPAAVLETLKSLENPKNLWPDHCIIGDNAGE